jgi:MATE family multidrug resistance protein
MLNKIINIGFPSAINVFWGRFVYRGNLAFRTLGTTSLAANQIALSLASLTFMFAMGWVWLSIRVGNQKGLMDYVKLQLVARSIFLLAILLETVFAVIFIVFHQYLPQVFCKCWYEACSRDQGSDWNSLPTAICSCIFQISDGIQVVVLGALRVYRMWKYRCILHLWLIG